MLSVKDRKEMYTFINRVISEFVLYNEPLEDQDLELYRNIMDLLAELREELR